MKKAAYKLLDRYRITKGKRFRLKDVDPDDTYGLKSEFKDEAKVLLQQGVQMLAEMQDKLYAQDRWSLLLVFQAMDAAGKDGTIKHVMSGVNPQGCEVASFKAPSSEELDHDFLWRCMPWLPNRGHIGIFNRSYYEEVLVVRVHPEFLAGQKLPPELVTKRVWEERYEDIRSFERYLARNGTVVRKFFQDLGVHLRDQHLLVVGAVEDPDAAALGQAALAAPQEVVVEVLGRGRLEREHLYTLRVHARHHVLDRAVLPGRIHRLEDHRFEDTPGGRRSHSIAQWSVEKIKRAGGDGVKVLAWYRPDAAPEILEHQKLASGLVSKHIWPERFEDIRNFERYLARNGTVIRKFFLHVSKGEQKRRFMSRLDEPEKNWKFSANDVAERRHWKDYQRAYEDAIRATATPEAPWYVVPADNKWFTRLAVAAAIVDALAGLGLHYPKVSAAQRKALAAARRELEGK